ncbi:MAG: SMC-Scp complex subunit ScpB [Rhodobiaceae bacterium]|nr:MAG: SMC-Scp complex subunit ScpB [Rhodobiaceae bacterium]
MMDEQVSEIAEEPEDEVAEAESAEEASTDNVTPFPSTENHAAQLRMTEALLFAAAEPLDIDSIAARLPDGADVGALIEDLQKLYEMRGVNLVRLADKWMFRTAEDLAFLMEREAIKQRRLSRAAMETLAIISYHQPVTRAEIEEIRGVSVSKGTIDVLMETSWVRLRGRRRTPGRPVTYGTTEEFLVHFGLESVGDLPGHDELRAAGLLEANLPADFVVPVPSADGGDGDGDFSDDEETSEEYGQAQDVHLEEATEEDTEA